MKSQTKHACFFILCFLIYQTTFNVFYHENICAIADTSTSDPNNYDSINRYSYRFNFNESVEQNVSMIQHTLRNEAIVQIYCYLFSNSTKSIKLLVNGKGWNVTSIPVNIGQKVNLTITNGVVNPTGGDVIGIKLDLWLLRESQVDPVYGLLEVVVLDRGWYPTPWHILPGVFALVVIWMRRKRNKRDS